MGTGGGRWEYCTSGLRIHAELAELGGLAAITLKPPKWPIRDDTVLQLAITEGLATGGGGGQQESPLHPPDTGEGPQETASPLYPRPTVE